MAGSEGWRGNVSGPQHGATRGRSPHCYLQLPALPPEALAKPRDLDVVVDPILGRLRDLLNHPPSSCEGCGVLTGEPGPKKQLLHSWQPWSQQLRHPGMPTFSSNDSNHLGRSALIASENAYGLSEVGQASSWRHRKSN